MTEYIERFSTIRDVLSLSIVTDDLFGLGFQAGVDAAVRVIANHPAADVLEPVRCKDCTVKGASFCMQGDCPLTETAREFFCSYGKRRNKR